MYKLKKQKNIKKQEHCICEFSSLTRKAPLDDPNWEKKKKVKKKLFPSIIQPTCEKEQKLVNQANHVQCE